MDTEQEQSGSNVTETQYEALLLELLELKDSVKKLSIGQVVEETQLPIEIVASVVEKGFKLGHPPLESEIRFALTKAKTMEGVARYLGVSMSTLRYYSKMYDRGSREAALGVPSSSMEGGRSEPLWRPTRGSKTYLPNKAIKKVV